MLKVFLVEDEFVVREGIKKNVDWQAHGYEFCGEASDGELALPMIQKLKPDIVITDIKMPFMDGLELSRLIKKEMPWTEIIILTGFEEFEYAKEAISIGVAQYLSKPINGAELLKEVANVAEKIEERRKEREIREKYEKEMAEALQQDREEMFQHLVTGSKSVTELIEMATGLHMDITAIWYNVLLAKVQFQNREPNEFSNHMIKIEERLETIVDTEHVLAFDRTLEGKAFVLKADSQEELEQVQTEFVIRMKELLEQDTRYRYFIGIGTPVNRLRELPISFEHASYAFAQRYFAKESGIVDSVKMDSYVFEQKDEFDVYNIDPRNMGRGKIREFLKFGNKEESVYFVEGFFHDLGVNALKSSMFRQYIVMDAYFCIAGFLEEMNIGRGELETFDANSEVLQSEDSAKAYVARIVRCAVELREKSASNRYGETVDAVMRYVEKNYTDEELSLNTIASHVNFSPNHLSMVFRQQTGQPLVKYVTDYRMNKAKELLRCTNKKSNVISTEVGYKDPHYFSYLFKKTQGMTPTQYREGKETKGENE